MTTIIEKEFLKIARERRLSTNHTAPHANRMSTRHIVGRADRKAFTDYVAVVAQSVSFREHFSYDELPKGTYGGPSLVAHYYWPLPERFGYDNPPERTSMWDGDDDLEIQNRKSIWRSLGFPFATAAVNGLIVKFIPWDRMPSAEVCSDFLSGWILKAIELSQVPDDIKNRICGAAPQPHPMGGSSAISSIGNLWKFVWHFIASISWIEGTSMNIVKGISSTAIDKSIWRKIGSAALARFVNPSVEGGEFDELGIESAAIRILERAISSYSGSVVNLSWMEGDKFIGYTYNKGSRYIACPTAFPSRLSVARITEASEPEKQDA